MQKKKSRQSLKAVLFDIDGTLIPLSCTIRAVQAALRNFGLPVPTAQVLKREFVSKTIREEIPKLVPGSAPLVSEISAYFIKDFNANYKRYGKLFQQVKPTWRDLRSRNLKIGIVTSGSSLRINNILKDYSLKPDCLVALEDLPTYRMRKPNPISVIIAMKRLHVRPSETIFIGDHAYDMMAARLARCKGVGVLTGWGTRQQLLKAGARYVISDLGGLSRVLENFE